MISCDYNRLYMYNFKLYSIVKPPPINQHPQSWKLPANWKWVRPLFWIKNSFAPSINQHPAHNSNFADAWESNCFDVSDVMISDASWRIQCPIYNVQMYTYIKLINESTCIYIYIYVYIYIHMICIYLKNMYIHLYFIVLAQSFHWIPQIQERQWMIENAHSFLLSS